MCKVIIISNPTAVKVALSCIEVTLGFLQKLQNNKPICMIFDHMVCHKSYTKLESEIRKEISGKKKL